MNGLLVAPHNNALHLPKGVGAPASRPVVEARTAADRECSAGHWGAGVIAALSEATRGLALVLLMSLPSVAPGASGDSALDLSGNWKGMQTRFQRGDCRIGRTGRQDAPVEFAIRMNADGRFTATVTRRSQETVSSSEMTGRLVDQVLSAKANSTATCRGESREYTIEFSGRLEDKRDRIQLELKGKDSMCPQMRCDFEIVYTLERRK